MQHIIITNNVLVAEKYKNVFWQESSVAEILVKVRDQVYQGYELVSHPLAASLGMLYSPYRSIIIGNKPGKLNFEHAEIIENSLTKHKNRLNARKIAEVNHADYQKLDLLLLDAVLNASKGKW